MKAALFIGVKATTSLALILHELATNAAKYGALCAQTGRLCVLWSLDAGNLCLDWIEDGTSGKQKGVAREGFGSKLARATATGQLSGTIAYDWRPDGVKIAITAPLERLQAYRSQRARGQALHQDGPGGTPRR